jgi:hypothetical protein
LLERGVAAGEIDVIDHRDVGTLFGFTDPDGNSWVVQQIRDRLQPAGPRSRQPTKEWLLPTRTRSAAGWAPRDD